MLTKLPVTYTYSMVQGITCIKGVLNEKEQPLLWHSFYCGGQGGATLTRTVECGALSSQILMVRFIANSYSQWIACRVPATKIKLDEQHLAESKGGRWITLPQLFCQGLIMKAEARAEGAILSVVPRCPQALVIEQCQCKNNPILPAMKNGFVLRSGNLQEFTAEPWRFQPEDGYGACRSK